MSENYGTYPTRVQSFSENQFSGLVFSKSPLTDDELTLLSNVSFEQSRILGSTLPSGFVMEPNGSSEDFVTNPNWSSLFELGTVKAIVDGLAIPVSGTNYDGLSNEIRLNPPPTSGARVDLVFLEVWRAHLDPTDSVNKPASDEVYPLGNTLWGGANHPEEGLHPDGGGIKTIRKVQIQYRIRVVGGGVSSGVDIATYPYGVDDPSVKAHGATGTDTLFSYEFQSPGLWRAGDGVDGTLGTVDGYSYAVPICAVTRRNSAGYDSTPGASTPNHNGAFLRNGDALNANGAKRLTKFELYGIAHNQTGIVAVPQITGTWLADSSLTFPVFARIRNGNLTETVRIDGIDPGGLSITLGMRGQADTVDTAWSEGAELIPYTDRLDGLYADQIAGNDIIDLRHAVIGSADDLLDSNLTRLLDGSLKTTYKTSSEGTGSHGVKYIEAASLTENDYTGITDRDAPNGWRTKFSDAATVETVEFKIRTGNGTPGGGPVTNWSDNIVSDDALDLQPSGWSNGIASELANGSVVLLKNAGAGAGGIKAGFNTSTPAETRFLSPKEDASAWSMSSIRSVGAQFVDRDVYPFAVLGDTVLPSSTFDPFIDLVDFDGTGETAVPEAALSLTVRLSSWSLSTEQLDSLFSLAFSQGSGPLYAVVTGDTEELSNNGLYLVTTAFEGTSYSLSGYVIKLKRVGRKSEADGPYMNQGLASRDLNIEFRLDTLTEQDTETCLVFNEVDLVNYDEIVSIRAKVLCSPGRSAFPRIPCNDRIRVTASGITSLLSPPPASLAGTDRQQRSEIKTDIYEPSKALIVKPERSITNAVQTRSSSVDNGVTQIVNSTVTDAVSSLWAQLPYHAAPKFGPQYIPYTAGDSNFRSGINHLFVDGVDSNDTAFFSGGITTSTGSKPMLFRSDSGTFGGASSAINGNGAHQAYRAVTITLDSATRGLVLPAGVGISRLYGVYEYVDYVNNCTAGTSSSTAGGFEDDRVTQKPGVTNLLRKDLNRNGNFTPSLWIVEDKENGEHSYAIPSTAFDLNSLALSGADSFDDNSYVIECSVFFFPKNWITENQVVYARSQNSNGNTSAVATEYEVEFVYGAPAPTGSTIMMEYSRIPYQGDAMYTRAGSSLTSSDIVPRFGHLDDVTLNELHEAIRIYENNGDSVIKEGMVNPRRLQVIGAKDFWITEGTGLSSGAGYKKEFETTSPNLFTEKPEYLGRASVVGNSVYLDLFADGQLTGTPGAVTFTVSYDGIYVEAVQMTQADITALGFSEALARAVLTDDIREYVSVQPIDSTHFIIWSNLPGKEGNRLSVSFSYLTPTGSQPGFASVVSLAGNLTENIPLELIAPYFTDAVRSSTNASNSAKLQGGFEVDNTRKYGLGLGSTERLPLGSAVSDYDFCAELVDGQTRGTFSSYGSAPTAIVQCDGEENNSNAYTITDDSGTKTHRTGRGGCASGINGKRLDFGGKANTAKSGVLYGRAYLVVTGREEAFSNGIQGRTRALPGEVMMVVTTCKANETYSSAISVGGAGGPYAACDRYRIEGRPLINRLPLEYDEESFVPVEEDRSPSVSDEECIC